jgi:hypothetical protein
MLEPKLPTHGNIIMHWGKQISIHPRVFDDPYLAHEHEFLTQYGYPNELTFNCVSVSLLMLLQLMMYDNWVSRNGPNYVRYN